MAGRRSRHARSRWCDMSEAVDRVMAGPERRSRIMSEQEKSVTAYHEAGHALVGHLLPTPTRCTRCRSWPAVEALGWTQYLPTEDRYSHTDRGARRPARRVHGRAVGRGAGVRRAHHGRRRRHRPRDPPRPRDGHRVRHERRARAPAARRSPTRSRMRLRDPPSGTLSLRRRSRRRSTPRSSDCSTTPITRHVELIEQHRGMLDRLAARLIEIETLDEDELAVDPRIHHDQRSRVTNDLNTHRSAHRARGRGRRPRPGSSHGRCARCSSRSARTPTATASATPRPVSPACSPRRAAASTPTRAHT